MMSVMRFVSFTLALTALLVLPVPASHAKVLHYFATLNGPNESPPGSAAGTAKRAL